MNKSEKCRFFESLVWERKAHLYSILSGTHTHTQLLAQYLSDNKHKNHFVKSKDEWINKLVLSNALSLINVGTTMTYALAWNITRLGFKLLLYFFILEMPHVLFNSVTS